MKIATPANIHAEFFMKGEELSGIDGFPLLSPHQVHGREIITVDGTTDLTAHYEADGVLLRVPGVGASLRFADCAPVLVWGSDWVMILHSGYKGTVLNISGEGLRLAGGRALGAWVGPCIGREYCRDVAEEWTRRGVESFRRENWREDGGKVYFDLAGEISAQLREAGAGKVTLSGINTLTDERCCSYRRGDLKERMTLYVRLVAC